MYCIDLIHSKNLNSLKPHTNETENGLKSSKLWAFPTAGADPKWGERSFGPGHVESDF